MHLSGPHNKIAPNYPSVPAEAHVGAIDDGLARIDAFLHQDQPIKQRWLDAELYRQQA